MKSMKKVTLEELKSDFESHCDHLIDYIKAHWNWKSFKPKSFARICKQINSDEDELNRYKDQKIHEKFTGLIDDYSCSMPFHRRTSPQMVAFDQIDQGRDPLTVLIQSCVTWGAYREMEITKRDNANRLLLCKVQKNLISLFGYVSKTETDEVSKETALTNIHDSIDILTSLLGGTD